MSAAEQMDEATHARLLDFCAQGDAFAKQGAYADALARYAEAWYLIPEPRQDWHASTWVLAAIGDACFLMGDYVETRKAMEFAMQCPEAIGTPFLHLRLGQALYEHAEDGRATDELVRAYLGGGPEIFADEHPRYLEFLSSRVNLES